MVVDEGVELVHGAALFVLVHWLLGGAPHAPLLWGL